MDITGDKTERVNLPFIRIPSVYVLSAKDITDPLVPTRNLCRWLVTLVLIYGMPAVRIMTSEILTANGGTRPEPPHTLILVLHCHASNRQLWPAQCPMVARKFDTLGGANHA